MTKTGSMSHNLMEQDVELMMKGNDLCWSSKFLSCMGRLNLLGGESIGTLRQTSLHEVTSYRFQETLIIKAFDRQYESIMNLHPHDPRTAPSRGLAMVKHQQWFHMDEMIQTKFSAPPAYIRSLLEFRIGSTTLRCHDHTLERAQRTCTLCDGNQIEDELHMIFECPVYDDYRKMEAWKGLFEGMGDTHDMKKFMNQDKQFLISQFVHRVLSHRQQLLDRNLSSQNFLGLDMIAEEHGGQLDMFDSDTDTDTCY